MHVGMYKFLRTVMQPTGAVGFFWPRSHQNQMGRIVRRLANLFIFSWLEVMLRLRTELMAKHFHSPQDMLLHVLEDTGPEMQGSYVKPLGEFSG